MISDVKSGIQVVVFLMFLAAAGYLVSQAVPAITAMTSLPARVQAENDLVTNKNRVENARAGAEILAVPTMMNLAVRATEQAIQNEKTRADSQADAQVLAAKGQADFQRSLGQALLNLVFVAGVGAVLLLVLRFVWGVLALKQVQQHARREGGGVSILPSGEVRYIEPRQQITSPSLGRVSTQVKKVEEKVE